MNGKNRLLSVADPTLTDQWLQGKSGEMAQLLSGLVQCKSISGNEPPAVEFIQQWLADHHWNFSTQSLKDSRAYREGLLPDSEVLDHRANVIAFPWPPEGRQTLVINGHLDVVPPGDLDKWNRDPFSGDIEDGFIYGRGAVDTKGGIVSAIFALESLRQSEGTLPFDVAVVLTAGEETTGSGTLASLEAVPNPSAVIVLEPTGNRAAPVSSGLLFMTIEVAGVSAHTSSPWKGRDAFRQLIEIHSDLVALNARRSVDYASDHYAEVPTVIPFVMGVVRAGEWRAAVPSAATMSGRWGILPGEDPVLAMELVRDAVAGVDQRNDWPVASVVTVERAIQGWETADKHPLVTSMARSCQEVTPGTTMRGLTAGSDAAFYGAEKIPTVVFGPGDLSLAHSPNERISESDLVAGARIISRTISTLGLARGEW
ncbi:M20 family metallopeptidase [Arthrobacter sp. 4R501]|uniref:M20 family metallopeptidase n=1 Tax=Arthrobacter sp. 4R501 TaxID=2058886 RepID=UPI0015E462D4|nr:ArgE/DapE family deacylase [Arthrobacter sp. 4R501]